MLTQKKILMVISPSNFRDPEYTEPREILEKEGAEITVASTKTGPSKGAEGTKVNIEVKVTDVKVDQYEAVIFVGGPGMVDLVEEPAFIDLARRFYEAGKVTTAICISPAILANSGILSGKKATVWSGARDALEKGGAIYTGSKVEVDGKIITANGPAASREFGKAVVQALK